MNESIIGLISEMPVITRISRDVGTLSHRIIVAFVSLLHELCGLCELLSVALIL